MKPSAIRQGLKASLGETVSANSLTLKDDRIVMGFWQVPKSEHFIADIVTNGPLLLIKGAELVDLDAQTRVATYRIECQLWFGWEAEGSGDYDLYDAEDLLWAIKAIWQDASYFTDSGSDGNAVGQAIDKMVWSQAAIDAEKGGNVLARVDIQVDVKTC